MPMPSELDRKFDAVLAEVTGPGGRLVIGRDEQGRAIVTNFPATLPALFRTFCALNADSRGGRCRRRAADLRRPRPHFRTRSRTASPRAASPRATASASRCATARPGSSPTWRSSRPAAIATLLNGWWQAHEMEHALDLTEPKLIIADAPRAKRIAARCADVRDR